MSARSLPNPRHYIAFSPQGRGVLCAVVYFEKGVDVYGWWIGVRDGGTHSAFFKLGNYHACGPTQFYATEGADLHGGWQYLYSDKEPLLSFPRSIDPEVARELEHIQGMFAHEWLFFDGGFAPPAERASYDHMGFAVRGVNVRSKGIARLDRHGPVWTYESSQFDPRVLDYLMRHWPLEYCAHSGASEFA